MATSAYGYDAAGRLTSLTHTQQSTTLAGYQFAYDAADRMTQLKSSADATTGNAWGVVDFTYDAINQLQTAAYTTWASPPAAENYGYDPAGNQDTGGDTVQSTGDNRQATDSSGYTYLYDAEGNCTAKFIDANSDGVIDAGDSDITTYQWDYRDRLTESDHFATFAAYSGGTSDFVVSYAYDYANRVVKETVDPDGSGGSAAVEQAVYAYDDDNCVLQFEKTGSGSLAASDLSDRYLWGAAVDQILADEKVSSLESPGAVLWGLSDHEGTIRDVVDNSGSVVDHRVFNSFGKMTSESAPTTDFAFGYDGTFWDSAVGMNRMGLRDYDPFNRPLRQSRPAGAPARREPLPLLRQPADNVC